MPVVAVEEPALLAAVQRVVGGVEIEHDLRRRGGMGLQEQVHQHSPAAASGTPSSRRFSVLIPPAHAPGPAPAAAVPRSRPCP